MKGHELYRIKSQGRIGGVCAGLADYFGVETWLVRIVTVSTFLLLAPPFVFVGYIALWFILEDKSKQSQSSTSSHKGFVNGQNTKASGSAYGYSGKGYRNESFDGSHKVEVKSKVWQSGVPPRQAFMDIKQRYESTETKLQKLESYVTSKEFQLNRDINRL